MVRNSKILFVTLTVLSVPPLEAANLGVYGHTFEIIEEDLLDILKKRLQKHTKDGSLQVLQEEALKRSRKGIERPLPVKGIITTVKPRTYFYDPSITVPYDLKDHEGRLIHKAGTKINPLKFKSLSKPLVFIDGDKESQVLFALKQKETFPTLKIILVKGAPLKLMDLHKETFYFDQQGILIQKLGIQQVPTVVSQEGLHLKVEELQLEGEKDD